MATEESMAERLRATRLAAGFTQQSLAAAAGTSLQVVTQIEQGNIEDPHVSTMRKLARTLGTSITYLYTGEEERDEGPLAHAGSPALAKKIA